MAHPHHLPPPSALGFVSRCMCRYFGFGIACFFFCEL